MPVAAILAGLKPVGSFFWGIASSRLGNILLAFAVAWMWSGHRQKVACASRINGIHIELKAKAEAEDQRRTNVLFETKREALVELEKREAEIGSLSDKLKELEHASRANDGRPGLDVGGVRRLNQF